MATRVRADVWSAGDFSNSADSRVPDPHQSLNDDTFEFLQPLNEKRRKVEELDKKALELKGQVGHLRGKLHPEDQHQRHTSYSFKRLPQTSTTEPDRLERRYNYEVARSRLSAVLDQLEEALKDLHAWIKSTGLSYVLDPGRNFQPHDVVLINHEITCALELYLVAFFDHLGSFKHVLLPALPEYPEAVRLIAAQTAARVDGIAQEYERLARTAQTTSGQGTKAKGGRFERGID